MIADHHQPRSNFSRKEPEKNLSRQNVNAQNSQTQQFINLIQPGLQPSFH
jgi:hypothetical protein